MFVLRRVLLSSLLALAVAGPSKAEPTWQERVEGWLTSLNDRQTGFDLTLDGLSVGPGDRRESEASFEAARLSLDDGGALSVGPGGFRVTALPDDLLGFDRVRLPSPAALQANPSGVALSLAFDLQSLTGTWDEARSLLRDLDLAAADLALTGKAIGEAAALNRIDLALTTTPTAAGRFDQTLDLVGQGLTLRPPEGRIRMDRLVLRGKSLGSDPDALEAWSERLQAAESGQARSPLPPIGSLSRESLGSILLAGLQAWSETDEPLFWLEELRMESTFSRGELPNSLTFGLLFEGAGLDLSESQDPDLVQAAGLVPRAWSLPVVFEGVPGEALADLLLDLAAGGSLQQAPVIDPERKVDFQPFLRALGAAGTRILVEELTVAGPAGSLSGGADLTLAPRLPHGVFGEATFTLGGIEAVGEALRQIDDPDAAGVAFLITTVIKGLGQPEVGPDGEIVYRYDLKMGRDGTTLLNGLPLDALLDR
ncbi:MAG: hypothetical protein Kilf2KO_19700 [Rhodospirillales bacterium]